MNTMRTYRVGADIGGTFTDLVLIGADGEVIRRKVPSTIGDYAQGILSALEEAIAEKGAAPADVGEVLHGTTVATNAILEQKGALCGLITTRGFRDVLELRRMRMPQLYRLDWAKPTVLVRRHLRREVNERIASDGSVLVPLDEAEVLRVGGWLVEQGVEALAVTLLNSYVNPLHERRIGELLRGAFPNIPVSLSAEILPEIQEYERTSTTVVNAYVQPVVKSYIGRLRATLDSGGLHAPLLMMQSHGGLTSARNAAENPVRIIESGPAAGVIACRQVAELCGYRNMIAFDMGGTTAKASLIEDGHVQQATEYEVGGGVSAGSRLNRGGGYVVRVPSIDIAEVGAGGGSLVAIDKAGGLQVGPRSAGAVPGPVCYSKGNTQPTVTDANVVLGYMSPVGIAGGTLPIDVAAAWAAIEERVAHPLGRLVEEAAFGIHTIANANMIRALRSVTIERGRDPSEFSLCAFGGSGPVHAAHIALAMEIGVVVVPPCPGLFSAFGLLLADVEHHYSRTVRRPLDAFWSAGAATQFAELVRQAQAGAEDPDYPRNDYTIRRVADIRYAGQVYSLSIAVEDADLGTEGLAKVRGQFLQEYERTYGFHSPGEVIEIDALRVVAKSQVDTNPTWFAAAARADADSPVSQPERRAYFGGAHGWLTVPVITRSDLQARPRGGPLIIEGYDATTVVPPEFRAEIDTRGNIVMTNQRLAGQREQGAA
ncbi:MAG: hydantoinase/oxoprolinase family protein [Acetobacteraceae bacterium]